jgi:hypothetical protein
MAQPPKVEKYGEFGVTAQFVIEVQPLSIRNSFHQFFARVPSYQPKSLLFKPKWIRTKIPDVIRDRIVQLALDEPDLSHHRLKSDIGPCPKRSIASILACPHHVRLEGNLGNTGCPVLRLGYAKLGEKPGGHPCSARLHTSQRAFSPAANLLNPINLIPPVQSPR